jgi:hypothetical protein
MVNGGGGGGGGRGRQLALIFLCYFCKLPKCFIFPATFLVVSTCCLLQCIGTIVPALLFSPQLACFAAALFLITFLLLHSLVAQLVLFVRFLLSSHFLPFVVS